MRRKDIVLTNDCTISVINDCKNIDSFSCGDEELDDYFKNRSVKYTSELLARNYAFVTDKGDIVTAFSYSNYCINSQQLPGTVRNRLQRKIPNLKRMRSYPALLIGRLGVDVRYHGQGLGSQTLDFIMRLYLHPDKEGLCRFVIVEAINRPETLRFYERNGFKLLFSSEEEELYSFDIQACSALRTRMMYCDLKQWRDRQSL